MSAIPDHELANAATAKKALAEIVAQSGAVRIGPYSTWAEIVSGVDAALGQQAREVARWRAQADSLALQASQLADRVDELRARNHKIAESTSLDAVIEATVQKAVKRALARAVDDDDD